MKYILLVWLLVSVDASAALSFGNDLSAKPHYRHIKQDRKVSSKKQAAKLAQNKYGGKVLGVKDIKGQGYRVKLLTTKGHIIYVMVNAYSGKVS